MPSIKSFGPNKKGKYLQGTFDGYNPKKYFGPKPIIYRSSYEKRFMITCELNPNVIKWSSEQIVVPYLMKEKIGGKWVTKRHNYFTDFTVHTSDGKKYIIEVKPDAMSPKNERDARRDPVKYKNFCKWKAAISYAKHHGYIFKVVTEAHLKTKIF